MPASWAAPHTTICLDFQQHGTFKYRNTTSMDKLLDEKDGKLADTLSAQNSAPEDVKTSKNQHEMKAAENLNSELECDEPLPRYLTLEMANFNSAGNYYDEPNRPETAFTKVRI